MSPLVLGFEVCALGASVVYESYVRSPYWAVVRGAHGLEIGTQESLGESFSLLVSMSPLNAGL